MEVVEIILKVCGGISIIGGAGAIVWKLIYPACKVVGRVAELERKSQADYNLLKKLEESNKVQNRMLFALLNHMIDGNNIENMKKTRDELQNIVTK